MTEVKPDSKDRLFGFRPDIEGLRAVAILAVVGYHAGAPWIGGGFIGVDIFFVVSGFLITGLLWQEATRTATVRLGAFYGARARRLLPAAVTVLVVTAVGSALLMPPLQARAVFGDAIAAALYAGNYRFAITGTDYLAADTAPSPLQHYWSLGVEEQFYLLWPALIIGIVWLFRRRAAVPLLVLLAAVAAGSFWVSLQWTRDWPSWAFFALPSRAWELAAGGLVALTIGCWRHLPPLPAAVAGWGGLGLILLTATQVSAHTPFPGTAALLPVLGTALVIAAGCARPRHGAGRVLSTPLMRSVGRLSYSWYLWHWPVLILAPFVFGRPVEPAGRLALVVISLGLAILTLHLVENPARFSRALRNSALRSLTVGGAVTAVAVCAALVLLTLRPVPTGSGTAPAPATFSEPVTVAARVPTAPEILQAAVTASAQPAPVPANLTPALGDAPAAKPEVFVNGCVLSWRDVAQPDCVSGDPAAPTTVALVGDSHAAMWQPGLEPAALENHWRLVTMAKVTCPPMDLPITSPYLGREFAECEQWRADILDRLAAQHPQLVIVDMARRYGADFGFTSYDPAWLDGLTRLVTRLARTGARVLVLGPVPDPHGSVPTCLSAHMADATDCAPARAAGLDGAGIAAETAAVQAGGGRYADLSAYFCTAERCPMVVGNTLVFRDDNHITGEYARQLTPVLADVVLRALS